MSKGDFQDKSSDVSDRILRGIREPQDEPLIDNYVNNRSREVLAALTKLVGNREAPIVAAFITSNATRFEVLAEHGHLSELIQMIESMDNPQRLKILCATESAQFGIPNATVIERIAASEDKEITGKFANMLRSFDTEQRAEVLAVPGAMWWMSTYDQVELMYEIISTLSPAQRQKIYSGSESAHLAVEMTASPDLAALFKGCTPLKKADSVKKLTQ